MASEDIPESEGKGRGEEIAGAVPHLSGAPPSLRPLAEWWPLVVQEQKTVAAHYFSAERCYAEITSHARVPLDAAQAKLLTRLTLGEQQKAIAVELGITPAAVTRRLQRCLRALGLSCRGSAIPLFLVAASAAFQADRPIKLWVHVTRTGTAHGEVELLSLARPDRRLPSSLGPAECEVARLLVEGFTQADIATRRHTSLRTAGNQVGAVFAKLGVSGRVPLLLALLRLAAEGEP